MSSSAGISCQAAATAAVDKSTIICSAIGIVGGGGAFAEDGNHDTFDSSRVSIEKEEEKKELNIIIRKGMAAGNVLESSSRDGDGAPTPRNDDEFIAATNASAWNPLEDVDSALLSALCDPRERKALYRLEQVMIDYVKDESSWSMEVGGAFNAIVLYQNVGGGASDHSRNYEVADGQLHHTLSQQGMQELQHQQQRGLKQTSFQRLILHRLADRFNVIREQIIQPYFPPAGNDRSLVDVGVSLNYSPGLIRLIKTDETSIPSNLLIDINLSLLINYKNPRARNYFGGGSEDGTKNITDTMASATLDAQPMLTSKKSKKMVIMKRSDSSNGSGENMGLGRDGKKDKMRRKKLEDREKAYEEARARIFGISESSRNENDGVDADAEGIEARQSVVLQSQDSQEFASALLNSSSCHSSFSVENDANIPLAGMSVADPCAEQPPSGPPLPETQNDQELVNAPASEAEALSRPSFSSSTSSAPSAVTKAVYRNRQQEENDPDFKRRSGVRPSYIPYVTNPYSIPLGANPYATMGQQPLPPQMVAMHMQQHANPSLQFYHGQAHKYQIPQDVAYAAHVVDNAPHQWTVPQHGYYPSIPQQQQQQKVQENLPQTWKIRSTSSQMQSSGIVPPSNVMKSSLPQSKQPTKVVWGPGVARGDASSLVESLTNSIVEQGLTSGDTVAYTPEDFPALG